MKILNISTLRKKITQHRNQGKTIAFTNGCFDILHYGHTSYLQKAKGRGDKRILIIGLNSDASVKKIKGPKRPIISQQYRAKMLEALECVDYVTVFNEPDPYTLIQAIQPDILIKGADWKGKHVIGSDIVRANGGRVQFIEFIKGLSTTQIIKKIKS